MTYPARWLLMINPELFCVLDLLATSPSAIFSSIIQGNGSHCPQEFQAHRRRWWKCRKLWCHGLWHDHYRLSSNVSMNLPSVCNRDSNHWDRDKKLDLPELYVWVEYPGSWAGLLSGQGSRQENHMIMFSLFSGCKDFIQDRWHTS